MLWLITIVRTAIMLVIVDQLPTVVKFNRWKVSKQILRVKKDFGNITEEIIQLTGSNKTNIDQSLCPYHSIL